MRIRPSQDLRHRVLWKLLAISLTAMLAQEPSQGAPPPQAAKSLAQRLVDIVPFLIGRFPDSPAGTLGPFARSLKMSIRPSENLADMKYGSWHDQSD